MPIPVTELSDTELVAASLTGDQQAFAQLVTRYQGLLCSLAYSATGDLSGSEDLAQETFLTAWQELATLREPEKLRSWLCGILRHRVGRRHRRDGREPVRRALPLEEAGELRASDKPAAEQTMNHEEQTMMWQALEGVPEIYREPLILYYREHRSLEHVAAALDLTEDTVKQRLSRGRKVLQEHVLALVERGLARTTPGHVFTLGVLALLPAFPSRAKAAGFGMAATQGSAVIKSAGVASAIASMTGVVTGILMLRAHLDQSRTARERRAVVLATVICTGTALAFLAVLFFLRAAAFRWEEYRVIFAVLDQLLVVAFALGWPIAIIHMMRHFRRLRSAERLLHPESFADPTHTRDSAAGEYQSRIKLFGVPLVHIRFASPDEGAPPVFGWIAGGDRAYGILFAWGGWAVGLVSVGAVPVGLLSVGGLSIGVISLGTFAVGLFASGAASIGVKAYAWLSALGWDQALSGGFAVAGKAAEGPLAFAPHVNDAVAMQIFSNPHAETNQSIIYIVCAVLPLVSVVFYARAIRQRLGGQKNQPKPDRS